MRILTLDVQLSLHDSKKLKSIFQVFKAYEKRYKKMDLRKVNRSYFLSSLIFMLTDYPVSMRALRMGTDSIQ